jgi:hypothetical protein
MAKALAAALETSKTSISQTKTAATVGAPAAPVKPVVPLLAYRPGYGPNAPADSTSVYKNNLLIDPFKKPSTPVYTNQFTFSQK